MSNPGTLNSVSARRTPQQERGERRLAQLLEAASAVMAEVGYDAATMTEIAGRAGASIGTLYQYFPDKEAILRALRRQYADEFLLCWEPMMAQTAQLSVEELVDRMVGLIVEYMERRPAYLPLMNAPKDDKRDRGPRNRLRDHFVTLFCARKPEMEPEMGLRVASVTVQVLKGMHPLYVAAQGEEREAIVREYKLLLLGYLEVRLGADEGLVG